MNRTLTGRILCFDNHVEIDLMDGSTVVVYEEDKILPLWPNEDRTGRFTLGATTISHILKHRRTFEGLPCKIKFSTRHTLVNFKNMITRPLIFKENDYITVVYDSYTKQVYRSGYLWSISDDLLSFVFREENSENEEHISFDEIQTIVPGEYYLIDEFLTEKSEGSKSHSLYSRGQPDHCK